MADIGNVLEKKAGPLPIGMWVVVVGGAAAAFVVIRSRQGDSVTSTVVQEVAVPVAVGATASPDYAPAFYQSISYFDSVAVNALTDTVKGTNEALLGNTSAINTNTSAVGGLTGAVTGNTAATSALTSQVTTLSNVIATTPPNAPAPAPVAAVPSPVAAPAPVAAVAKTYTIRSGDTLSAIAKRYTGNANNWRTLYNANAATIDARARKSGKAGGGNWIFPGTVLNLPAGW